MIGDDDRVIGCLVIFILLIIAVVAAMYVILPIIFLLN